MPVLTSSQRSTLESTVIKARKLAEKGASNALKALAVDQPEPYTHMKAEDRSLRNRLRNKARLLGDELSGNGSQNIDHLFYELAYEYWHKMLFARFLEANNLLIHPEHEVPVSLEECEDLANNEGYSDKWTAAANYASKMLPAIFRPDDPLMQVDFATEDRIALENLISVIEGSIFTADDSLGWVYQFWQSEAKDRINKSGEKINGEKLPAVTQLFTEPYMVHFLIDNTIGAWWISRHPNETPPVNFEYLRLLDDGTPATGKFEGWPDKAGEITTLDPCMGSGHFIVDVFLVMVQLRMYEEKLTKEEATDKVISENIHGLEIDPRCTQIAAFNLALSAWKFCGKYKSLPELNLACCGIAPRGKKENWIKLAGDDVRMQNGMAALYELFQQAPELGSLLDPTTIQNDLLTAPFEELKPVLEKALNREKELHNDEQAARGLLAMGINSSANILTNKYNLVITNVPFLGLKKMQDEMNFFCQKYYQLSKADLSAVIFERCFSLSKNKEGYTAVITPQSLTFLGTFKNFRNYLLSNKIIKFICKLGIKSFQISMYDFTIVLWICNNQKPGGNNSLSTVDLSKYNSAIEKARNIRIEKINVLKQINQLSNPDFRITVEELDKTSILGDYAISPRGVVNGDIDKWTRKFWELPLSFCDWRYLHIAVTKSKLFSGCENIIDWSTGGYGMLRPGLGNKAYYKKGISISRMALLPATLYLGELYDQNTSVLVPNNQKLLPALWEYCSSELFNLNVRKIDQKVGVTPATLLKIPFDKEYWQKLADEKFPKGLPLPCTNDPTQWLFHGHPIKSEIPLHVIISRLMGYRWPAENDTEMELADEAKELIIKIKVFDSSSIEDGILCIPSVNGEMPASDQLRDFLQKVYEVEWTNQTIEQLLIKEGSDKSNLEAWLRDEFFIQHCKIFHNRPFIWQIWDGRIDGFSVLVNYHKLTKENLQKLIFTYLGDWIRQCELKLKNGESGAGGLLSAAKKLKTKLELILEGEYIEGERSYDIFVRWKTIEKQPIGWDPDLNDGVRINIRPFIEADVPRKKPNIKWGIDRGKNPPDSPWGELRDNDKHLTLAEKISARENN